MHNLVTVRPQFFIAHNSADVVHWGEVGASQNISTGQPNLELFELDQRSEWHSRIVELGVDSAEIEES